MADASRPILVGIVGIVNIVLGLAAIVTGVILIADIADVATNLTEDLWEKVHEQSPDITKEQLLDAVKMLGALPLVSGIISTLIGAGIWCGWRIMWYIGIVVNALELILAAASIIFGFLPGIVLALINALIIYYLLRPGVKAFFNV